MKEEKNEHKYTYIKLFVSHKEKYMNEIIHLIELKKKSNETIKI